SGASEHAERPRHALDRLLDVVVVDVEMRHSTEDARMRSRREADPLPGEPRERVARVEVEYADVDLDEVRLHLLQIDRHAGGVQTLGQSPGPHVVVGEPRDVVVEGVDAGRRNDSGLPHRSAELVLETPRLLHQLVRAGDERPERAAEAFRETECDRVELPGDVGRRNTARDRRVQDTGAVKMDGELELPARRDQRTDLLERPDPATGSVVRVFDRDDPGPWRVRVVA